MSKVQIEVGEKYKVGGFNPQTAPIEDVIEYLTVTLKKKWGVQDEE